MGLPNLFSKKKSKKNNLFILTLLTDQSIHSSLWQVYEQKIILLNKSKVRYYNSADEQLLQMDESLQDLGDRSEETDEVLFAFEPSWIKNNKISSEHEKELKELTESLSLKPLGFVSTTEAALQHLLKSNNFLSSIVLYIGSKFLDLIVVRQGKVAGSLSVGRSQDIVSDLQEALARLDQDFAANGSKLPPNIILSAAVIDAEKLRLYQQQLFSLNWTEDFNFVQKPIIEIINANQLLDIVTKYYGEVVAKEKGLIQSNLSNDVTKKPSVHLTSSLRSSHENEKLTQNKVETTVKEESKDDLSKIAAENQQTSFGVPIKQSALDESKFAVEREEKSVSEGKETKEDEVNNFKPVDFEKIEKEEDSRFVSINNTNKKNKKLSFKPIIIISVILGLVVSSLVSYFLLKMNYQVEALVTLQTKDLSKEAVIKLDSSIDQSDPVNNLLKADIVTEEVSGQDTIQTTGVKLVGEKAKGKVTLFNKTDEDKTFAQGTVLKTENLEFELDSETVVPAASIEETEDGEAEVKEFGKKSADVTAKEIGDDSNIGEKTDLKIADFSESTYSARTENDFSGGSSREIRVVADDDHEELLANLKQRLLKQARDTLETNSSEDIYILSTDDFEVVEQNYSDDVGEEVDNVSLDLTLAVEGLSYTNDDLLTLAKKVLENDIPEKYIFIDDSLSVNQKIVEGEEESTQTQLAVEISGKSQAQLNDSDFKTRLIDVSMNQAESLLKEEATVDQVQFVHTPFFARYIFKSLPNDASRILIKIEE